MAIYQIRHVWNGDRADTETRRRKDTAADLVYRMARNELVAGWAGLDTPWGWNLCRRALAVAKEIETGVGVGWSATLASGHPMHGVERLEIERIA